MRHKEFHDLDHIVQYLCGSVIRHKGIPVYAKTAQGSKARGYSVYLMDLEVVDRGEWVMLNDPDLDMNPVPLGFINYYEYNRGCCAIKASRYPARAWKIGLSTNNLGIRAIVEGYDNLGPKNIMFSKFMKHTIMGQYPSLIAAHASVRGRGPSATAFSRNFAIDNGSQLWHLFCEKAVGTVGADDQVNLNDRYKYLAETLQKDVAR